MNLNAFIFLFLTLMNYSYSQVSEQCMKSNAFWNTIKYPYDNILKTKSAQSIVLNCPSVPSLNCCTSDSKKDMTSISEIKLKEYSENSIDRVLKMLSNDSYDLFDIFLKDLEKTKNDLHQLFSTTYGYNYKMNKNFFFTWFDNLKLYTEGRLHNIGKLVDTFFKEMATKIVTILIAPGTKLSAVQCHTARLMESNPYQNTDTLLKTKILRSYPPARLLANSIAVGRDVFNGLFKNLSPSQTCKEQYNSIFHCMVCDGLVTRPCSNRCRSVIGNCFGPYGSSDMRRFDRTFTKYIKMIVQLAGKLDNPFNFLEVNSKMNVQISTGIMNIQTMYPNIKEQIQKKCQTTNPGSVHDVFRRRRQASEEFYKWQTGVSSPQRSLWENSISKGTSKNPNYELNNYQQLPDNALLIILRKIKLKYKPLENYFQNKKSEFCSHISVSAPADDCWNGTAITKNSVSEPGLQEVTKKQSDKVVDVTMKSAVRQLEDITERISSYLSDSDADPGTVPVQDYRSFVAKNDDKPPDNGHQNLFTKKIEGSGDSELNKPQLSNVNSEKVKPVPDSLPQFPLQPDKASWEFPSLPEGSGETNKGSDDITQKTSPLQKKKKSAFGEIVSLPRSFLSSTKASASRKETVVSNQISDDEDLNPVRQETSGKKKVLEPGSSSILPIIQPEGSGNEPPLSPDLNQNSQATIRSVSTTQSSTVIVDGSGDDMKPKPGQKKSDPIFPLLPESRRPDSSSPSPNNERPIYIPDTEVVSPEGSGKSIEPPIGPIDPQLSPEPRLVTQSTSRASIQVSPDNYPGKVPSEVWLPGLEGARNRGPQTKRTTPSGSASRNYNQTMALRGLFLIMMLIRLSLNDQL